MDEDKVHSLYTNDESKVSIIKDIMGRDLSYNILSMSINGSLKDRNITDMLHFAINKSKELYLLIGDPILYLISGHIRDQKIYPIPEGGSLSSESDRDDKENEFNLLIRLVDLTRWEVWLTRNYIKKSFDNHTPIEEVLALTHYIIK